MTFGSLFAGIGGLDLGLERAGMTCVWQVEINDYCRHVLAKHWPTARRHDDVETFNPDSDWSCDLVCGGFPCQDVSLAGKGAGIDGSRSGLWREFARIIRLVRPAFVLVENVTALLGRGLDRVLGDLAALGFDAEWHCIPAAVLGASHIRDRAFVLAYTAGMFGAPIVGLQPHGNLPSHAFSRVLADTYRTPRAEWESVGVNPFAEFTPAQRSLRSCRAWDRGPFDDGPVDDGLSAPVDALDAYGNAVVPQVAEWIGRRIMEAATCDA